MKPKPNDFFSNPAMATPSYSYINQSVSDRYTYHIINFSVRSDLRMGRWMKPEVYPLMAAMGFVTSMCIFQLTRNVLLNPDVRVNKAHRRMGVLENGEEGEKYAEHGLRRFLRTRPPQIMPTINRFFSQDK